jgi:aspartyl-tRNA(Asn)/glutamyl-tRNA(Gln) amidotransferase subunit A
MDAANVRLANYAKAAIADFARDRPHNFSNAKAERMTSIARFPDWSSLSDSDRFAASAQCQRRFADLGQRLNAVEQIYAVGTRHQGLLRGLPYVAKDMFATGLSAPSWGCKAPQASSLPRASLVDRLDQAGALLLGTAVMTELAYEPSGVSWRTPKNPWGFDMIPGGSSSGSAILVASGCCFAALGSDTGGSVRIPAHCCGITALKPGYGRLPLDGAMTLAPSLDTAGIFARSAIDLAPIWPLLSGEAPALSRRTRSGVLLQDAFDACEAEIAGILRGTIDVLAADGVAMTRKSGFPEQADAHALTVLQAEAAREHAPLLDDSNMDATLRKRLRKGLAISDSELDLARGHREALCVQFLSEVFDQADVVFLPVMPIKTPRVEEVDPASALFNPRTLYTLSRFTRFVNYLGLPALALPAGFDGRGMPVGLQIIGRPGSEAALLEIGISLQERTDWHGRVPSAIASDIAGGGGSLK